MSIYPHNLTGVKKRRHDMTVAELKRQTAETGVFPDPEPFITEMAAKLKRIEAEQAQ